MIERPKLRLTGRDGNAFHVLGLARQAAERAGWPRERWIEFRDTATSGDYDHLLATTMEFFDVS